MSRSMGVCLILLVEEGAGGESVRQRMIYLCPDGRVSGEGLQNCGAVLCLLLRLRLLGALRCLVGWLVFICLERGILPRSIRLLGICAVVRWN